MVRREAGSNRLPRQSQRFPQRFQTFTFLLFVFIFFIQFSKYFIQGIHGILVHMGILEIDSIRFVMYVLVIKGTQHNNI